LILKFETKCKPNAHSLITNLYKKKWKGEKTLGWDSHKLIGKEFKVWSNCASKNKGWAIQVGTKMVHGWTTNNNFHKINHGQDLERKHHLLPYSYSLTNDKGYIKVTKSLRGRTLEHTQFLWSCEFHNFVTL